MRSSGWVVGLALAGAVAGCVKTALGPWKPLGVLEVRQPSVDAAVCPLVSALTDTRRGLVESGAPMTPQVMPVVSYLVRVHGHLFLVDAGLIPPDVRAGVSNLTSVVIPFSQHPASLVAHQLVAAGITPGMLSAVVLTHAHLDHAGELEGLPEAPVWMAQEEATWIADMPDAPRALATGRRSDTWLELNPRIQRVQWQDGVTWGKFDHVRDVFGDGTLRLVHTPGHTPGSMSVVLRDGDRQWVFAGDVSLSARHIRGPLQKGLARYFLDDSPDVAWETVQRMNATLADQNVTLLTAHDETVLASRHRFRECAQALLHGLPPPR